MYFFLNILRKPLFKNKQPIFTFDLNTFFIYTHSDSNCYSLNQTKLCDSTIQKMSQDTFNFSFHSIINLYNELKSLIQSSRFDKEVNMI